MALFSHSCWFYDGGILHGCADDPALAPSKLFNYKDLEYLFLFYILSMREKPWLYTVSDPIIEGINIQIEFAVDVHFYIDSREYSSTGEELIGSSQC